MTVTSGLTLIAARAREQFYTDLTDARFSFRAAYHRLGEPATGRHREEKAVRHRSRTAFSFQFSALVRKPHAGCPQRPMVRTVVSCPRTPLVDFRFALRTDLEGAKRKIANQIPSGHASLARNSNLTSYLRGNVSTA